MFRLFRKDPRRPLIDRLYGQVVAAARRPPLFHAFAIPDTLEGRFEALVLHLVLVVRALSRLPPPAEDLARDITESFFTELDHSLREMGVGDLAVPKRMKGLAEAYFGRAAAYGMALDATDAQALTEALARNIYGASTPEAVLAEPVASLARYVLASASMLAALDLDAFLAKGPNFPPPAADAQEAAP